MTPELPPLPGISVEGEMIAEDGEYIPLYHGRDVDDRDAVRYERERILTARIAELEREAKEARQMAWAIIRAAAGESWLTVPHHVVISINDGCAIERHDDDGGHQFRAIAAARGKV